MADQLTPPRRRNPWPVIVTVVTVAIGVGLFAAAFGGLGKETGTPVRSGPKMAGGPPAYGVPLGSTMTITDTGRGVQDGTIRFAKTYRKPCNRYFPDPEQGVYLVIDVTVAQRTGEGSVNPLDFTFVGADGATADAVSGTYSGCDTTMLDSTNDLRTGQERSGQIVFDVPSPTGSIEWAPGGLYADPVGSWRIG